MLSFVINITINLNKLDEGCNSLSSEHDALKVGVKRDEERGCDDMNLHDSDNEASSNPLISLSDIYDTYNHASIQPNGFHL